MIDHGGPAAESMIDHCNALVTVTPYTTATLAGGVPPQTAGTPVTNVPAIVQPVSSSEVIAANGLLLAEDVTFYLPASFANGQTPGVTNQSTITHNSVVYEVIGEPVQPSSVGGWLIVTGRRVR